MEMEIEFSLLWMHDIIIKWVSWQLCSCNNNWMYDALTLGLK